MKKDITEKNLISFLENILDVEGEISLNDFIERVSKSFNLSSHDLSKSLTRPGELMFEQRCRNIVSHKNFPKNLISYVDGIFKAR